MSKPIINGGPAFPHQTIPLGTFDRRLKISVDTPPSAGMSLRDWFAGQALQSLIAQDPKTTHALDNPNGRTWDDWIAMNAYQIADTMLAARATTNTLKQ